MTNADLKELRQSTKLTQANFAAMMGVPTRTYEDLEAGRSEVRQIHINAALWAVLTCFSVDMPIAELPGKVRATLDNTLRKLGLPPLP